MAESKTKPGAQTLDDLLAGLDSDRKRSDTLELAGLMQRVTGQEPVVWSGGMVGFGDFHYRYPTGHQGHTFLTGFAPRKSALTLYLGYEVAEHGELLEQLGKHKLGKGCLYINKLADVDMDVLEQLVRNGVSSLQDSPVNTANQAD